jgi:hypothetical protein
MNKFTAWFWISMLGAALAAPANARDFCSLKTLRGTYVYALQGVFAGSPLAESGMESYDGQGHVINVFADSLGRETSRSTGTYVLNGQCQGIVTYSSGNIMHQYVSPKGDRFTYVQISGNAQVAGVTQRVSKQRLLK